MRSDLLRRLERLERRFGTGKEHPAFVIIGTEEWQEESASGAVEGAQPEDTSGPKGSIPEGQPRPPGAGEKAGTPEWISGHRRKKVPPLVVVRLVRTRGRESLACGERVVRDWSRDGKWEFHARERITSDPADHGLRCEPGGRLENDIRLVEQSFELESGPFWFEKNAAEEPEG